MSQDFRIFNINNQLDFNELALKIFYYQAENVEVYKKYLYYLGIEPKSIDHVEAIPFLPIRFFKSHKVIHKDFSGRQHFYDKLNNEMEINLMPQNHLEEDDKIGILKKMVCLN